MAKGIRDLSKITDVPAGGKVTESTLFEGVVGTPDDSGILGRQVSGKDLEDFMAREGGAVDVELIEGVVEPDGNHTGKAYRYTDDERARAKAAEEGLGESVYNEECSRILGDTALDRAKANKVIRSKPLSGIQNGEAPNLVTFWRSAVPAPIQVDGKLELSDGSFFETSVAGNTEFSYTSSGGAKTVIYDGVWRKDSIDCGAATVSESVNIEGSVWDYSRFGGVDADLPDVWKTAVSAIQKSADALQAVTLQQTALTEETEARKAKDIEHENAILNETADRTNADVALDGKISDLKTELDEDIAEEIVNRNQAIAEAVAEAIPALPTADGEYKLVISGGAASWELIV